MTMEAIEDEFIAKVHVVNMPIPDAKSKEIYSTIRTFQSGVTPEVILPQSPKRVRYFIQVLGSPSSNGNAVIAGSSGDAQQVSATYQMSGAQLIPGLAGQWFEGQTEIWLVCPFTNPPLVSVIAEYCR
jgi:hypothetical protein